MIPFALNHMTVAQMGFVDLIDLAATLGCVGIELRNDLPRPLFDGIAPEIAGKMISDKGLQLLAVAEVKRFNDWSEERATEALALMRIAQRAGAQAVSLIPRNDRLGCGEGERQANLRIALRALKPMLQDCGLIGLIEPLGFEACSLRHKGEVIDSIKAIGGEAEFRLVHDTFHHTLAQSATVYPLHTGIIHISGVSDQTIALNRMTDAHRGLVDRQDRLSNTEQITQLRQFGCTCPISFEAFAPEVHSSATLASDLRKSMEFIREGLAQSAA